MVASETPDDFDESELSLSKTLAANVEAAMDRADRRRELKRQNERLETFAGVVSHDLRNPLSVARGFLELARDGDAEALDRVEEALDRMESLIESLLALARAGEAIGELEQVDLGTAAEAAWRNVDTGAATLSVETDATVQADAGRLEQLFENLFRNSVEHGSESSGSQDDSTPAGAGVSVAIRSTSAGFAVDDDGSGISESEREDVFEYGYTSDTEGTGLGLAIVRQIAEAHGWTVSAGESPEGGARFEFAT
jgi:signal transduction histidine kinase